MPTYSPLFDNNFPLNTIDLASDRRLAKILRPYKRRAAIMKALNGQAVGATALVTEKRVQANTVENGGRRVIETVNIINRATTNADKTNVDTIFVPTSRIATPVNKAGPLGTL